MRKIVAFGLTGAGSLLAEGVHSLADVLNQALLYLGVTRAERDPDELQAGYGREQYVWSLISAVGIFLGCGVLFITVYTCSSLHILMRCPTLTSGWG